MPVYHHKEDRAQAHILVAFLGCTLFKTLDMWCVRSGLAAKGVCWVVRPSDLLEHPIVS